MFRLEPIESIVRAQQDGVADVIDRFRAQRLDVLRGRNERRDQKVDRARARLGCGVASTHGGREPAEIGGRARRDLLVRGRSGLGRGGQPVPAQHHHEREHDGGSRTTSAPATIMPAGRRPIRAPQSGQALARTLVPAPQFGQLPPIISTDPGHRINRPRFAISA